MGILKTHLDHTMKTNTLDSHIGCCLFYCSFYLLLQLLWLVHFNQNNALLCPTTGVCLLSSKVTCSIIIVIGIIAFRMTGRKSLSLELRVYRLPVSRSSCDPLPSSTLPPQSLICAHRHPYSA